MLKRVLRYLKGTVDYDLHLLAVSTPSLLAYIDADWAGCPDTRRSTSGYGVYLGNALVSWSSKCQNTVSRSSAEAEYRGLANAVAKCSWLHHLLDELHHGVQQATIVFCDNISSVYMSKNPVHHRRAKHIDLDIHFVREKVAAGELRVLHVPSDKQLTSSPKDCRRLYMKTSGTTSVSGKSTAEAAGGLLERICSCTCQRASFFNRCRFSRAHDAVAALGTPRPPGRVLRAHLTLACPTGSLETISVR
jgi:hypothetical protein